MLNVDVNAAQRIYIKLVVIQKRRPIQAKHLPRQNINYGNIQIVLVIFNELNGISINGLNIKNFFTLTDVNTSKYVQNDCKRCFTVT